jgi:hypothetical protein
MTNSDLTLIAALLDRTGSMVSCKESTEKGFDELINGQKQESGRALVTLAQFDLHGGEPIPQFIYEGKPINDVPGLRLEPRGLTPLWDAVGGFITRIGEDLDKLAEDRRPGLVICVIMTDGEENASKKWSLGQIKELITQQREQYNWKFLFLGANIDAVEVGASMGIDRGTSLTYNATDDQAVMDSYAVASAGVSQLRGGASNVSYSASDRSRAMGKNK